MKHMKNLGGTSDKKVHGGNQIIRAIFFFSLSISAVLASISPVNSIIVTIAISIQDMYLNKYSFFWSKITILYIYIP